MPSAAWAKQRDRAVRFWLAEFRSRPERYAKDRAWRNALECAEGSASYLVCAMGLGGIGAPRLVRVTRRGRLGAIYGKAIYKGRPEGRERVWVWSGVTRKGGPWSDPYIGGF